MAVGLEDMTPPLAAASEEIRSSIRQRFETETDPDGVPWLDLSPAYQKSSGKPPRGQILKTTGELQAAATAAEAMVIAEDTVFYRTDTLPHYGLEHELGGPKVPARPFLGISDEDAAKIEALFFEWAERNIDLFATSAGNIGVRHAIRGEGGRFAARSEVGLGPLEL